MNETRSDPDRDDALARLLEEIERLHHAGRTADVDELAQQFDVPRSDVDKLLAAFEWAAPAAGNRSDETPNDASSPLRDASWLALPDDYEVFEEIGRGGMGIVYRARQRSLDREIAIKILRPGELTFGHMLARFQKEAKALARLRHPHIVSIHHVGLAGDNVYFTMDWIQGGSLADLLKRQKRPMPVARTLRILRQVTEAVAYTHSHGLIHRDIKPANILLDEQGEAYLADFGLARDPAAGATMTATGDLLGTPDYMAPEQALGDKARIGEATDVYALGAVLYECLTGRAPFADLPLVDKFHAVVYQEPRSLRRLNPKIARDLERISETALAKTLDQRYPTASALREDLERFEQGIPVAASGATHWRRAHQWARRHGAWVATLATTLAMLVAVYVLLIAPRMGRTASTKLADASELLAMGEHRAALKLFEDGLAIDGEGAESMPLRFGAIECRLHLAEQQAYGGDKADSVAHAERAEHWLEPVAIPDDHDGDPSEVDRYWGARTRIASLLYDGSKVDSVLDEWSSAWVVRTGATLERGAFVWLREPNPASLAHRRIMAQLPDGIGDSKEWLKLLRADRLWSPELRTLLVHSAADNDRAWQRTAVDRRSLFVNDPFSVPERQRSADEFAELAEDRTLSPQSRSLSVDALAVAAKLPTLQGGHYRRPPQSSQLDEAAIDELVDLWRTTRDLAPAEQLTLQARTLASSLARRSNPVRREIRDWIKERLGERHSEPDALQKLATGDGDAWSWLRDSLSVEDDVELSFDLAWRMLSSGGPRLWHEVLCLTNPNPDYEPSRNDRYSFDSVKVGWGRIVDPAQIARRPRIRIAYFYSIDGEPARLFHSVSRQVAPHDPFEQQISYAVGWESKRLISWSPLAIPIRLPQSAIALRVDLETEIQTRGYGREASVHAHVEMDTRGSGHGSGTDYDIFGRVIAASDGNEVVVDGRRLFMFSLIHIDAKSADDETHWDLERWAAETQDDGEPRAAHWLSVTRANPLLHGAGRMGFWAPVAVGLQNGDAQAIDMLGSIDVDELERVGPWVSLACTVDNMDARAALLRWLAASPHRVTRRERDALRDAPLGLTDLQFQMHDSPPRQPEIERRWTPVTQGLGLLLIAFWWRRVRNWTTAKRVGWAAKLLGAGFIGAFLVGLACDALPPIGQTSLAYLFAAAIAYEAGHLLKRPEILLLALVATVAWVIDLSMTYGLLGQRGMPTMTGCHVALLTLATLAIPKLRHAEDRGRWRRSGLIAFGVLLVAVVPSAIESATMAFEPLQPAAEIVTPSAQLAAPFPLDPRQRPTLVRPYPNDDSTGLLLLLVVISIWWRGLFVRAHYEELGDALRRVRRQR